MRRMQIELLVGYAPVTSLVVGYVPRLAPRITTTSDVTWVHNLLIGVVYPIFCILNLCTYFQN